jgi:hypothetical protein
MLYDKLGVKGFSQLRDIIKPLFQPESNSHFDLNHNYLKSKKRKRFDDNDKFEYEDVSEE